MMIHVDVRDTYDEVNKEVVNIFHIVHIKRVHPRNADSDCVLIMRNGSAIHVCMPIYELIPQIQEIYKNSVAEIMASIIIDAQEQQPKKKRTRRKS